MQTILAVAGIGLAFTVLPRIVVDAVATAIGVALVARSDLIGRDLLAMRAAAGGAMPSDAVASRTARRLMRAHLRLAMRQTELASLLPATMARARRIAASRGARWPLGGLVTRRRSGLA